MDMYNIWFDLKPEIEKAKFASSLGNFLNHMREQNTISSWRLSRCKLGLRPNELPEFHVVIETKNLEQLDRAFHLAISNQHETDQLHFDVNSKVTNLKFALYRDWPDG